MRPAALLLLVFALASCGGSDEGSNQAETYANGVCGDLSTWVTQVQASVQSVKSATLATAEQQVNKAVNDVSDSTDELVNNLKGAGVPTTDDGDKAKSQVDALANQLSDQIDVIKSALESKGGALAQVAAISTALATMETAVRSAYDSLKELDPSGELQDAFKNADNCKSLQDQVEQLNSGS